MSRPSSNGSNPDGGGGGAAAFNTGGANHLSRASTHSIPVSYAYGAPSIGTPKSPHRASPSARGHHRGSSRMTDDGASVISESEQGTTGNSGADTGRAKEPAKVRYARIAQRKKDTGTPFPPPKAGPPPPVPSSNPQPPAPASRPVSGARGLPFLASSNDTSVNIATAFAQAVAGNVVPPARTEQTRAVIGEEEEMDHEPVYDSEEEEEEEDQEMEEEEEESFSGKETHTAPANDDSKKRKKRSSGKDPSFKHRAGETESDDELSDDLERKKAKRAKKDTVDQEIDAETAPETAASTSKKSTSSRRKSGDPTYRPAPTSDVESEDYSDDARARRRRSKGKGRASTAGSAANAINIGRRDGEVWYNKNGKKRRGRGNRSSGVEGMSGLDEGDNGYGNGGENGRDDRYDQAGYEPPQDDFQPQHPTSFFLRPATPPSGSSNGRNVQYSPGAHAPFDIDPSFAAFDKSIHSSFNRSNSLDDSGFRGSSYDYSEEERIVAALERQMSQQQQAGAQGSGLRKRLNYIPVPIREPDLVDIREEGEEREDGGSVGRNLGRIVAFAWSVVSRTWRILMDPSLDWNKIGKAGGGLLLVLFVLWTYLFSKPTSSSTITHRFVDFVPFLARPPTYTAPPLPPDSFAVLVNRLTVLENALGQLSTLSDSQRILGEKDHSLLDKVSKQVTNLQDGFEQERERTFRSLEANQALGSKASREVERVIKGVKADLENLVTRVKAISEDQKADENDIIKLQNGINTVGKEIASLGTQVAQVAKDAAAGANAERISKIALDAIEARLPAKLAVRLDPSGKLEIDPAFWKYLRDAFAEKKEVNNLVNSQISSELAKRPSSSGSTSSSKLPSWQEFLVSNEASLRSWVESDISSRLGSDAVVSKKTFLDILHREIKQLKIDFETKANENVQKIGEELLSKVAKQEQLKKDATSRRPTSSSSSSQQVTIKSSDGTNISELIESLVDTALLRYSKDVLAKPDYALYTSGGRVIPSLTSPTYEVRPVGLTPRLLSWIAGIKSIPGRPPVVALHPDNSLGSCWPFAGSNGQLGILLSRRVVPTDVTIEHASVDVALDGDVSSAPKDFEVWGVVEGRENLERLRRFRAEQAESARRAADAGAVLESDPPASLAPTPEHILLAAGSYDISASSPIQTFPVTAAARQLGIPVSIVVVKILSNNGDTTLTCLYRVRISGASEMIAAASSS